MARVCVFDVNETLLDLTALDPVFDRIFGTAGVRQQWFGQLLQSALVSTVTNAYADFGTIGRSALEMVAHRNGRQLSAAQQDEILETLRRLPPHSDVPAALDRLQAAGRVMATLTNSTAEVARTQLTNAGIDRFFDRVLSSDAVRRLKPAAEPYQYAARELGVEIGQVRLIAAHAWDVAGAMRAGAAAAFVARPGMVLDPLAPSPDIVGRDLADVADRILAVESS
jgi:2-haloacid dehalogenase